VGVLTKIVVLAKKIDPRQCLDGHLLDLGQLFHSLLQAGAILALEIMLNFIHVSDQTEEIANDAEKVLR
jgi:hypothetical protein